MDSERARIQRLLDEGKITGEEARKLLDALGERPKGKKRSYKVKKGVLAAIVLAGAVIMVFLALAKRGDRMNGNLLINPGFEKGTEKDVSSWSPSISAFLGGRTEMEKVFVWDNTVSRGGEFSISIKNTGDKRALSWRQTIKTFPAGKRLVLTGYIKTKDVSGDGSASLQVRGLRDLKKETFFATTSMSYDLTGTRDWTGTQVQALVGDDTEEIQVLCQLEGSGTIWCDDLELRVAE